MEPLHIKSVFPTNMTYLESSIEGNKDKQKKQMAFRLITFYLVLLPYFYYLSLYLKLRGFQYIFITLQS